MTGRQKRASISGGAAIDFGAISAAALAGADAVLERWLPGGRRKGREYVAINPTRSDASAGSFSVNLSKGNWADFATGDKGGDLVSLVAYLDRCSQREARDRLTNFLGMERVGKAAAPNKTKLPDDAGQPVLPVPTHAQPRPNQHARLGHPANVWHYRDASGRLLFHVCRFDHAAGKELLPLSLWSEGKRMVWRWKGLPEPRPLYGLDRLASRTDATVLVCEGEKDADAAADLLPDFVVVTSPNGSRSADKADWSPLRGRRVLVWPDADQAGDAYARDVARLASAVGAAVLGSVSLETMADLRGNALPDGWGAADALAEGLDRSALAAIFADPANAALEMSASSHSARAPVSSATHVSRGAPRARFVSIAGNDAHGRRAGVYWLPVVADRASGEMIEGEPQWVCSPLRVAALTRDSDGGEWGRLLEFPDRDGNTHRWAMPMTMLARSGDELREELLRKGLEITADPQRRRWLAEYIQTAEPGVFACCVDRTGWHGNVFVLPCESIGAASDEALIFQTATPDGAKLGSAGTLADWRENVAKPCAGNSRLVLAVSMALAACSLGLIGVEGGGLHFRGASSAGKSTALAVAASVFGPPGYRREWRATDNSLEAVAAMHSDLLLILDEIGQLDPKHAAMVAYMLSNGQGKARARRDGSLRAPSTWRLLFLSGGEVGLADLMAEAGGQHRAGMEVRVIDVPADAGAGLGLFDIVPNGLTPGAFADAMKESAASHYGTALPAFLQALTSDLDRARRFLSNAVKTLAAELAGNDGAGQVRRVAQRFALIAAAGEWASVHNITGWASGEAEQAARRCFADWLAQRGTKGASEPYAMLRQVQHFLGQHGEGRCASWDRAKDDRAPRTLSCCGWRKATEEGNEYYLFAESFRREICRGFDPTAVARVLVDCGTLLPESERCYTRRERLPDGSRTRVYRILPQIMEAEL